jgi:hypothetical protein
MATVPANEKLWAMIVTQAKAKYTNYPNPGASHWVHQQYLKHGGRFIETSEETRRKKIAEKMLQDKLRKKAAHKGLDKDKDKKTTKPIEKKKSKDK